MAPQQYGMTVRTPGATRRSISTDDPQQQALMDAMQQNGVQNSPPIDQLPTRTYAAPSGPSTGTPGNERITYPEDPNRDNPNANAGLPSAPTGSTPSAPTPVNGGVTSSGGLGSFSGQMAGFDSGKLNDPNKSDPKYDFGKIASNYDPRQGIQQGMLDQLNALGHGTWGGTGDNLTYNGQGIDAIQGYKGGNGMWAWQPDDATGAASAAPQAATAGMSADPLSAITQLQSAAQGGDTYSALVMKYLMQQLGLDQGMLANSQ